MKITGLEIGEYRQFRNTKFDFTYPEGHPKEGKPLDKVCFIGQSGTGKTTLLNIIWDFFQVVSDSFQRLSNNNIYLNDDPFKTFQSISINSILNENPITLSNQFFDKNFDWPDKESAFASSGFQWLKELNIYDKLKDITRSGKLCSYIDDDAISLAKNLLEERNQNDRDLVTLKGQTINSSEKQINRPIIKISDYPSEVLWSSIIHDIDTYDESLKQFAASLVSKNSFSSDRLIHQISQWQNEHPNPRADLADNCLDQILRFFFLEVDKQGTEARVVLKTQKGAHINGKHLSSGTKQLLSTSIPIYKLNVNEGVILFDEPERSLFPDIQRELISHYTSLAPTAQFFFATHSPIIASAFEPCERFILYFDENGEVRFRNGVAPEGDDPNDILSEDFGLAELMLPKGLEAYDRYRKLGVEIRNEKDPKRKEELIVERAQLGDSYKF